MSSDRIVIIESPFSAETPELFARNLRYFKAAALDCHRRGEASFASHGYYPNFLHDAKPEEREAGMKYGLLISQVLVGAAWLHANNECPLEDWTERQEWLSAVMEQVIGHVVYTDLGISAGMQQGIDRMRMEPEYRQLGPDWELLLEGRESMLHITAPPERDPDDTLDQIRDAAARIPSDEALAKAVRKILGS